MHILDHVDAISRARQRDVLYLEFHPVDRAACRAYQHEQDAVRAEILRWLDAHGYGWQPCGPIGSTTRMESWRGQVCLDLGFDEALPDYRLLRDMLEHPDGTMKHASVRFRVAPLVYAMRNAEHDTPGYWAAGF
jgi:hypothetical protein